MALFKPAKRCPFCAHKLDATTKLCTNKNCIDYQGKITATKVTTKTQETATQTTTTGIPFANAD